MFIHVLKKNSYIKFSLQLGIEVEIKTVYIILNSQFLLNVETS